MADSKEAQAKTAEQEAAVRRGQRRRTVRLGIILPMVLGFLLILTLAAAAVALRQGAALADIFFTVAILCPMVICMLPIYLVLVILIGLMGRANDAVAGGLLRLNGLLGSGEGRIDPIIHAVAQLTIRWNSMFAILDKLAFHVFDPNTAAPTSSGTEQEKELP
ncbi:MAG: hypothetical protein L6Q98_03665 [Anaerolineae bacterium]|nr:hypothetical protein [Anaerolineae bacterium]NUQ02307.1 hypothetical protein [Anaerolineae bacterium]